MPEISLTDFVDFVTRSGSPKLTKVRELRGRGAYDPIRDFWKALREGLVGWHTEGQGDRASLDAIVAAAPAVRQEHYAAAVAGYRRFLGRRSVQWFEPPREIWRAGDLSIRVNPELGLVIDGVPTVVKVHFKSRPLSKRRIEVILLLMEDALRARCANHERLAVLDCWTGRLHHSDRPRWQIRPYLIGEAMALDTMWRELDEDERRAHAVLWGRPTLPLTAPPA